jgi:hypothetical protein
VTSLGAQVQVDENGVLHATRKNDGPLPPAVNSSPDSHTSESHRTPVDKQLGRLVINEDRSRYVSNQFWASMGDEVRLLSPSNLCVAGGQTTNLVDRGNARPS